MTETMPKPSLRQTNEEIMFEDEYMRQSLILSSVSPRWRRLSLSMPDLWPIRPGMHPDAFAAFLSRTHDNGMFVYVIGSFIKCPASFLKQGGK